MRGRKLTEEISLQELRQMREDGLTNNEIARRLDIAPSEVGRYLGPNPLTTREMNALRKAREKEQHGRLAGFVPGTAEVYKAVREALLRQMEQAAKLVAEAETITRHTPALMMAAVEAARELRMWEEVRKWDLSK